MPARPVAQIAMDEITIDDPVVEKALEARYRARVALDGPRLAYREADDVAKDAIKRLELPDGGVVRVGRFRVTRTFVNGRSVSFGDRRALAGPHRPDRGGLTVVREEPCLLCGGRIVADPADPAGAVLEHARTDRHRTARGRTTHPCPSCRMVTIPSWRERCHGCARMALVP